MTACRSFGDALAVRIAGNIRGIFAIFCDGKLILAILFFGRDAGPFKIRIEGALERGFSLLGLVVFRYVFMDRAFLLFFAFQARFA